MTSTVQAQTNDTQTNTESTNKTTLVDINNPNNSALSLDTALRSQNELESIQQSTNDIEAKEYQNKLSAWKEKQAALWEALPKGKFTINASAYTAAADECGKSDGVTASGVKVKEKRTLACPANMPFGTKISIEGMGVYTCEDRGSAIVDNHVDIYVATKTEAFAFGRKTLNAEIIQ